MLGNVRSEIGSSQTSCYAWNCSIPRLAPLTAMLNASGLRRAIYGRCVSPQLQDSHS
jgi:hypothetical protein